jgi:hypothetical protein
MTYSSGGPGYPGAQPPGGYAPTTQLPKVDDGPSKLPLYLLAGVAILGLAAYLLSFGPAWKSSTASGSVVLILGIVAMLFAALFAVTALLPKQGNYTPVVTATSVVGFLLIIWDLIKGGQAAGWALIVIVVVSALQTVVAIAALLLDAGVITPPAPRPRYDPYQPYGGGYYAQPSFSGPPSGPQPPHAHAPQGYGPTPGYPPQFGYPGGPAAGGFPTQQIPTQQIHQAGPPTPPTGFPTYAQPPNAPASSEQQPASPAPEGMTQLAPVQQQSPSPSGPPPS